MRPTCPFPSCFMAHENEVIPQDVRPEWSKDPTTLPLKFEPDSDRIVVMPDPEETRGAGGFEYAETTKGNISHVGTVMAVGKGENTVYGAFIPMRFEIGDRVMYSKYAGDDLLLFEDGTIRPYLGSEITGSVLVKIIRQTAVLSKVSK